MNKATVVLLFAAFFAFSGSANAQEQACEDGTLVSPKTGKVHECSGMTLLAHLTPDEFGHAVGMNDMWGWKDEVSGREFVMSAWRDGVSVIEVTDPSSPAYVALIPKTAGTDGSTWRDLKVYKNHAYIVAETDAGPTPHGVQVVDLSPLSTQSGDRIVLMPSTVYGDTFFSHNIVINEETGFAYAVGSSGGEACGGGLHAIDLASPDNPVFAGCIIDLRTARGYTHDAQCVIYNGPDQDYQGKEICIGSNENAVSIMDVTDKSNPGFLGIGTYPASQYVHQAWLSEDHRFLFQNDELDELRVGSINNTRTMVWDVQDLNDPMLIDEFFSIHESIDHNMYIKDGLMYQSNYIDGLHVLDVSDPDNLNEVAFFDTHPATFTSVWDGTWSNYPFLSSGAVAVNSDPEGVFILCLEGAPCSNQSSVDVDEQVELPMHIALEPAYPNPFNPSTTLRFTLNEAADVKMTVTDALGRNVAELLNSTMLEVGSHSVSFRADGLPSGNYLVRLESKGLVLTRQIVLMK